MRAVLLTGATGFVGSALYPALLAAGLEVRCATRQLAAARARAPERSWVFLEVERAETLGPALEGVEVAYYLVHSMGAKGGGGDWEQREEESARRFAEAAARAGVRRIVYLGGIAPSGRVSRHLRSRLRTGEILRQGEVPVIELRAGMIVGAGSESWQIVRDLSLRLPVMVLPAWLQHRSQPVAIADVVAALVHAGSDPELEPGCYSLPGPEALTGQEILTRVAALRGLQARAVRVPFITPRLSSYWIGWVTRADITIARELVEGLVSDLIAQEEPFWNTLPGHRLTGFDQAARAALNAEASGLPRKTVALEWAIQHLVPWKRAGAVR